MYRYGIVTYRQEQLGTYRLVLKSESDTFRLHIAHVTS